MKMGASRYDIQTYGEYKRYLRSLNADNSDERDALKRNLNRAIKEELTARQWEFMQMYFILGMTMTDIAEARDVNVSTVSRTISRGLTRLKRCLRYGAKKLLETE